MHKQWLWGFFSIIAVNSIGLPLWASSPVAAEQKATSVGKAIKVGKPELIYTQEEIPIRYDGTVSTLRKDGKDMCFFSSYGCRIKPGGNHRSRHSWFSGPPEDPLKVHLSSKTEEEFWDYNGYYQNMQEAGLWILALHQLENGDLLAITHAELQYPTNKIYRFRLGLGYSTDKGAHFTYCGEIIKAADDITNVGGGAYILRDGYIYAYYNDGDPVTKERRECVARAKLDDVVQAAARHQVTTWNRYRDGRWATPALSDTPGSNILPRVYGGEDLHSDAAYCTALDRYLMTVQTHSAHKLLLFASTDGLDWKQAAIVDETAEKVMQPYAAFVDYNSPTDDGLVVGGQFYIYYPRMKINDQNKSAMYRRLITIE
ncbi:MAG: hypothetical protein EPN23_00895 [Verrucomicrobia bacterium]|nr:MAG: hypothetical protein EPN23_00895 [Verrucomicrobiota bacterium]